MAELTALDREALPASLMHQPLLPRLTRPG